MNKILFIKSGSDWYIENHIEYLIRYLGGEFLIEQADIPYPPYENFLDRFPETSPLMRNPDDYDLLIPELGTHPHIDIEKYKYKIGCISWEGLEGYGEKMAVYGSTNPQSEKAYKKSNIKYHSLRIGIDTELFKSYSQARVDKLLHVGWIGSYLNPRHRAKEILEALKSIKGIKLMFFPSTWVNKGGDVSQVGGMEFVKRVATGHKKWVGIPNCYNQIDVLVRVEQNEEYGFPVLEAAACKVPVVATAWGNCKAILDAGGGITINHNLLLENQMKKTKKAVEYLRDNPDKRKKMGYKGYKEIQKNWKWNKHINNWRKFFKEGIKNAQKNIYNSKGVK